MIDPEYVRLAVSVARHEEQAKARQARMADMQDQIERAKARMMRDPAFREECRVRAWHESGGLRPGIGVPNVDWPDSFWYGDADAYVGQELERQCDPDFEEDDDA